MVVTKLVLSLVFSQQGTALRNQEVKPINMEKADIKKKIHLALVALFFYVQKGTDGNNVTLLPDGIADVISGKPLSLQCVYSGTNNPFTFNFYLNPDTNGLQIRISNCMIASAVGYNTSLYNQSCGTNSVSLIILAVSQEYDGQKWECDVSFLTADPIPPKASTIIRVTAASTTRTTTITVTSSSLSSTSMSSTTSSATTDNTLTVLPPNDTNNTSTTRSPTITGSAVGATSSTSASTNSAAVSYANNTSNVSTSANPSTAEPTAITKTSTDNNGTKSKISDTDIKVIVPAVVVPCGLLIIGAIVLVIFCVRRKARKNVQESPDGMAIQDKCNNIDGWKQSLGHGRATDNLDTVYTTPDGFIIYTGSAAVSTDGSYKDKKYHGVTDQYSRPYPDTYSNQTVYFSSTNKSDRTYAQMGKTYDGHQPVYYPMATSRLAYDLTVSYPQTGYYGQIDTKGKTKNPGPRTFHTSTQYKVEPKTINKPTDDRKQPVPPVNTGFEDTPTFRQLPQPPQNGEIKDRSLQGRSATIDDTPGLANETSRNNILPPLPLKQETVQEENASKEPKKKRKNKKKKDQMNVETPEEENGETIL